MRRKKNARVWEIINKYRDEAITNAETAERNNVTIEFYDQDAWWCAHNRLEKCLLELMGAGLAERDRDYEREQREAREREAPIPTAQPTTRLRAERDEDGNITLVEEPPLPPQTRRAADWTDFLNEPAPARPEGGEIPVPRTMRAEAPPVARPIPRPHREPRPTLTVGRPEDTYTGNTQDPFRFVPRDDRGVAEAVRPVREGNDGTGAGDIQAEGEG